MLPVARALSMGVHESQSLLWERMVFQSRAFWEFAAPRVRARFAHVGEDVGAAELYAAANVVAPGLIRVDADEVSYPLHIVLRFELEQALFDGSLAVDDALPAARNRRFEELVGLRVPDDARGILQDVHWGAGAIGYFPSYTLGAIAAAQLFAAAKRELGDLDAMIARGEFAPLREWLREKVHSVGSVYSSPDELLTSIAGEPVSPRPFLEYLTAKYEELYEL